ncbi:MAG: UDP-N-acetylmuramoyl-tripeptide--D-alanyl-D-alanine ligase [Akkermansiaceae bacterium]
MKPYSLQQLAEAMSGTLPKGGGELVISTGVSTDTRKIAKGALFVALKGDRFDAHNFLEQAIASGAGALAIQDVTSLPDGVPAILVNDTQQALQDLAKWYRNELGIPVIAISGSNGKTSTKDFTRSVLSQRFRVNATLGNLNNHIGLPLTVLATKADDEVGVFEMGMNHAGELAPLCEIARPDISIITNVGTAHIEFMGSREAIAHEKGTLARALSEKGTLLIPSDCEYLDDYRATTAGTVIAVGEGAIRAENVIAGVAGSTFDLVVDNLGRITASISIPGRHMVSNALLAAGAGVVLGMTLEEIAAGLKNSSLTSGRLRQFESNGITVLDDTYNANPESIIAALQTLADQPTQGVRTAVLGKMAEQGEHAGPAYVRIGAFAGELGLRLVSVGAEAVGMNAPHHFETVEEASGWLSENTHAGDLVLFKGSRAAAIERVMNLAYPE